MIINPKPKIKNKRFLKIKPINMKIRPVLNGRIIKGISLLKRYMTNLVFSNNIIII